MKPLLVGEVNPLSDRPEHALYPYPPNCTGARLQKLVMAIPRLEYMQRFDRVDLCVGKWSIVAARARAAELLDGREVIVLLGTKVCEAFGVTFDPYTRIRHCSPRPLFVVLPHPSGLCRLWHQPGAFERAREVLRSAGVLE